MFRFIPGAEARPVGSRPACSRPRLPSRLRRRWFSLTSGVFFILAAPLSDAATDSAMAAEPEPPLTMEEAARLASVDQPLLLAREARIEAESHQAIVAAQLPDPQLAGGVNELPIDTSEAFSTVRDNFTEFRIGLSQEFPQAEKRRLRGARKQLDADTDRAALDNERRMVRRDSSLAWLDVYEAEQGLNLTRQLADETALEVRSLGKEYASGHASQADWLAGKVDAELAADRAHDWLHHVLRARAALERWVGRAADRPIAASLTMPAVFPPLAGLMADADHHPVIEGMDRQIDASATDVALARQSYKPDYSVEVYYAYRREFADFVGIQFKIGLPYFTRDRQDQDLAAALQQTRSTEERKRDLTRELHAEVNQDYTDRRHYEERVAEFDAGILPDAARRIEAARSAYQSGRGTFDAVLLARRGLLDVKLQRLALAVEAARAQVRLDYWSAAKAPSGEAP
jgi:outer membrane protein TolC